MSPPPTEPVLASARREAAVVLVVWLLALAYTVGYAALFGYGPQDGPLEFVLGVPRWVFFGIAVPWLVCTAFTAWFCLAFMEDDPWESPDSGRDEVPGAH